MQQLSFDDMQTKEVEDEERVKQLGFDPEVLGRQEGRWFLANRSEECKTQEQYNALGRYILGDTGFKDDSDGKKLELFMKGWQSLWR
jgi:hypothetical protein